MAEPVSDVKAGANRFTRKDEAVGTGVSPIKARTHDSRQTGPSDCLQ